MEKKHIPYGPYEKYFKRPLDIFCGLSAVTVFSWLYIILMILGAIFMGGNPFFTQERPGKDEKIFRLIKFRSMDNRKDKDGNLLPDDVRLNKYGRLLRKTSLDELPEAFNIIKGDMSFVGPRPPLPYHPWEYSEYTPRQLHMFDVRPGITGWAQVHGRKDVEWHKRIELNCWYVDNMSLWLDIKILLTTVIKVLKNEDNVNVGATLVVDEEKETETV